MLFLLLEDRLEHGERIEALERHADAHQLRPARDPRTLGAVAQKCPQRLRRGVRRGIDRQVEHR